VVPADGLPAWEGPDAERSAMTMLDPGLEVRRVEQRDDGWAHIVCANDWTTWVDGRRLVELSRDGFDSEVFAVLEAASREYGKLLEDFTAGRMEAATFQRQAFKVGLVVRDNDAWVLELPTGRWWRYDGMQLTTIELPDEDSMLGGEG
jgi:hypothetical protein